MSTVKPRCSGTVYHGPWSHSNQCSRAGVLREDGKYWCKQHAPSLVAKKQAARSTKWDAEYKFKTLGWDIQAAKNQIAEAAIAANALGYELGEDASRCIKKYLGLCEKQIALKKELGL